MLCFLILERDVPDDCDYLKHEEFNPSGYLTGRTFNVHTHIYVCMHMCGCVSVYVCV